MKKIRAIIIDDERKAIETLKYSLTKLYPAIEIIGETQNPEDGICLISKLKPQLVFLDIAMPQMSGFDLLSKIENPDFELIFVTAFDEYAIEAIRNCAIGYLVKPVDKVELVSAIDRANENIQNKSSLGKNLQLIQNIGIKSFRDKKITIPTSLGMEFIKITDIIHCEGIDGYTKLYFEHKKPILSSNSIGYFSKVLEEKNFFLTHKSHLINLDYIEKYLKDGYVILTGNSKIPVSRSRRADFLNLIKNTD